MDVEIKSYSQNENGAIALYLSRVTRSLDNVSCVTYQVEPNGRLTLHFLSMISGGLRVVASYHSVLIDASELLDKMAKHSLINIFEKESPIGCGITYKAVAHNLVHNKIVGDC